MITTLYHLLLALRTIIKVIWFIILIPLIALMLLTDAIFRDGLLTWDSWVEHYWSEP